MAVPQFSKKFVIHDVPPGTAEFCHCLYKRYMRAGQTSG